MKKQFTTKQIKDRIILSLFFKRPDKNSPLMELYLAGSVRAKFDIKGEDIVSPVEGAPDLHTENWTHEDNALICDKVKINPKKELQQLLGRKMRPDELLPLLQDGSKGVVDELIKLFFIKLNKIYAKQKLYGREVKNFDLAE